MANARYFKVEAIHAAFNVGLSNYAGLLTIEVCAVSVETIL
jgi:hypothetical protein